MSDEEIADAARTERFAVELTAREWGRVLGALKTFVSRDSDLFAVAEARLLYDEINKQVETKFRAST